MEDRTNAIPLQNNPFGHFFWKYILDKTHT